MCPVLIAQIKSHDPPPRTVNHVRSNYSIIYLGTDPSTTLAELFTRRFRVDPSSAVRASLRRQSNDELDDGVAYGWQAWLRWRPVDSFFPATFLRGGDAGGC